MVPTEIGPTAFRLLPILCMVRPHELLVGVEEDSQRPIAPGHPDGQDGSLEPGAQVEVHRLDLVLLPDQETDVIPTLDSCYFPALKEIKTAFLLHRIRMQKL